MGLTLDEAIKRFKEREAEEIAEHKQSLDEAIKQFKEREAEEIAEHKKWKKDTIAAARKFWLLDD